MKITELKWAAAGLAAIGLMAIGLMPLGAGSALANGAGAGIVGSPHDLSAEGWNWRKEICRVCHVPHDHQRANELFTNGLLWNHQLSNQTYTMYNSAWSSTIDGTSSAGPDGIAKLCLGCHDGTVGIGQFDTYSDGTVNPNGVPAFIQDFDTGFRIGRTTGANTDLRGTHPISITYDPGADPNLRATTSTIGASGTIADVLDAGKVQCSSCHDVHDQESVPGTHLLRVATAGVGETTPGAGDGVQASGLCLTCHIK